MRRFLLLSFATLALSIGVSSSAFADTVSFALLNPTQTGQSGATLAYNAVVSAPLTNSGIEFLNGDSFTFTGPFLVNDTPFLTNFPLSLNPGQSVTAELFAISLPLGSSISSYSGTFSLLGGSTASTYSALGTAAAFTTTVTPEPSSLLLLGTGLLGFIGSLQKRRSHSGGTNMAA